MDLIILICSGLNIKFRRLMIDNDRATVDIYNLKIDEIVEDIKNIYKIFKTKDNCVLVVPADFCLLYNVSDFIILIYNYNEKKFDLPHLWESKRISKNTKKDKDQIERETRQKKRMRFILDTYNDQAELDLELPLNIIKTNINKINKLVDRKENSEIFVDKCFSVVITSNKLKNAKNFWHVDLFEELMCGGITPIIFRGIKLFDLTKLIRNKMFLYIKVEKNIFKEFLKESKHFDKIQIDDSIYNSKLSNSLGTISVANLIHLKYDLKQLDFILRTLYARVNKSHLLYGNNKITEHNMI
ncbi:hypothetical protein JW977_02040 [Candidatus Falkowbacteria bacterium]|nr:hypothetical protein [Candidatus Falkowbacteria bacterium]